MKKIIYSFVGALFFALSVNAQEITVKLIALEAVFDGYRGKNKLKA